MSYGGDDSLSQLERAAWDHWGLKPRRVHLDREPPDGRLSAPGPS